MDTLMPIRLGRLITMLTDGDETDDKLNVVTIGLAQYVANNPIKNRCQWIEKRTLLR